MPDAADEPFRVIDTGASGLGWIASRRLCAGDTVLRERPIAILRARSLHEAFASDAVIQELAAKAQQQQQQQAYASSSSYSDEAWWPRATTASRSHQPQCAGKRQSEGQLTAILDLIGNRKIEFKYEKKQTQTSIASQALGSEAI